MKIRVRDSFSDVSENTAYITYVPCDLSKVPSCEEYVYGKEGSIILKNVLTGELEQINYRFIGAMPFITRTGYQTFWGEIQPADCNCCLVFHYTVSGKLELITASFCSKSPSSSELDRVNEKISYAAQATAVGDFGPIPF